MFETLIVALTGDTAAMLARATALLVGGVLLALGASRLAVRLVRPHVTVHHAMLVRRGVFFVLVAIFTVSALRELGFNLTVLLGAAGLVTVAVGFAAQTSASNFISGLFLIAERPFAVGDVITVGQHPGGTTGEVISIDALSVKLRTFDNLFVRIPNELLIKSEVITLTRFPIRRIDVKLSVAYKENVDRVRSVLEQVAERNDLCLDEPSPLFIFLGFGESGLEIQFSVWAKRESFLALRNGIYLQIKEAFDEAGIEIPFPHRSLYSGTATAAFPVRLVAGASAPQGSRPDDAGPPGSGGGEDDISAARRIALSRD